MTHWKNLPSLFTRAYFHAKARVIRVFLGDVPIETKPKVSASGSLGWSFIGKKQMTVGDARVWCQVSVNVTVIGSKVLPVEESPKELTNVA